MQLPKGTVTFACVALTEVPSHLHDQVRLILAKYGAALFQDDSKSMGAAFTAIIPALTAATALQRTLTTDGVPLAYQPAIALHTGPAQPWNNRYAGETYNRAQSILAAVHPGQIILSAASYAPLNKAIPSEFTVQELGSYRLNDLLPAMPLAQVVVAHSRQEFPPLKTLEQVQHNLPILVSPLIGRDHEVQAVRALLDAPATRLVTVLGSSGAGKTRLALQVAVEQVEAFPDGVFVVSLAPVIDPNLVLAEIAHTLHIKEQGQQPLLETVVETLANKRLLVILDNFEQLLAAAPLLDHLLTTTHLKFLVTSQIACEIPQEQIFHLPPLSLPEQPEALSLDELSQIPAVALFIQRARDINPSFAFNSTSAPAVVELCDRLGGLPLAIELVAAQSKRYFPNDMLLLLKRHLLMAHATGRGNSRKDILYPVMDWICVVLGTKVANFFARLGVFAGGCTPESAAICNPSNELGLEILPTLNLLLDNHLLLREELKADYVRFTMLDAVHEYAQQRLDKRRETPRFQRLHAEFYTALAEEAEPLLLGATQIGWLNRLEATHHNLRTALNWAAEHDRLMFMRLAGALRRLWFLHAHFSEGRHWLELASSYRSTAPTKIQADVLHGLGLIAVGQGRYAEAQAYLLDALELRRSLKDSSGIIVLLGNLGAVNASLGNLQTAIQYTQQGIELSKALPQPSENDIGMLHNMLNNLGVMALQQADFALAKTYLTDLYTKEKHRPVNLGLALALCNLGHVEYLTGNFPEAKQLLNEGIAAGQALANEIVQADSLTNLAKVLIVEGNLVEARTTLQQAVQFREKHGDISALAVTLESMAELALAEGQPIHALWFNTMVFKIFEHAEIRSSPLFQRNHTLIEEQAQSLLDEAAFQAAHDIPEPEFDAVLSYVRAYLHGEERINGHSGG